MKKRWLKIALIATTIAFLPTIFIIISRTWLIEHANQTPLPIPSSNIIAEVQQEKHTCGIHTLHSIYRAYGMDPAKENIRRRLGTDYYALVWLRSSTGTLQPDMEMVLEQDHFKATYSQTVAGLQAHLNSGHLAAVLIKRPETGGLHWVAARASKSNPSTKIRITDSLKDSPVEIDKKNFTQIMVTAILVKPRPSSENPPVAISSLLSGTLELIRSIPNM